MNEKFTPGPWVYKGEVITVQSLHGDICDLVTEYNGKQMPFESNGFLISAAPELYEELKRHCALCMLMHPDCEGCEFCDTGNVLKKARGEK